MAKENEKNFEKVSRAWGNYIVLEKGERYKIKKITVEVGKSLSLQKHFHRSEHWVVVQGAAQVTIENEEKIVRINESIYVPIAAKHQLANPGKTDLIIIEVQLGDYLSEDDIVRFEI